MSECSDKINSLKRLMGKVGMIEMACLLLFCSCSSEKKQIKTSLEKMTSNPIQLNLNEMEVRRYPLEELSDTYKMVVYVDSSRCTPCALSHLRFWNPLIKEARNKRYKLDFVFILAPKKKEMPDVDLELEVTDLPASIYIDTAYVFARSNVFIPKDEKYHTFLLDGKNKVVLVGNPINNDKIKDMLKNKLNKI